MRGSIRVLRRDQREPISGLPGPLPAGEEILWQGKPTWGGLARRVCHLRALGAYVLLLGLWCGWSMVRSGHPLSIAALGAAWVLTAGCCALGLLAVFALLSSRTTTYTITTKRIFIQFGVAMTMTVDVPFRIVEGAALRLHSDGTGDIPLALSAEQRASYAVLWPHVRPWRLRQPEPMLRSIPDAARVAGLLGQALAATVSPTERAAAAVPVLVDAATPDVTWQPANAAA